jgi:hypothetical protein
MTVPFLNVKPKSVKLKVSPRFPAQVTASSPIILTKNNGSYQFSFDANAGFGAGTTGTGPVVLANSPALATPVAISTTETMNLSVGQTITTFPGATTDKSDFSISQANSGSHTTTSNSAFSISSTVAGSGINGPLFADYGATISVIKNNFLTSSTLGEIDGLTIITRQGQDDTAGILVNTGGVAGFMAVLEGVTNQFQATTGTILQGMDVQLGYIETGLTGSANSGGLFVGASTGTLNTGILVQSASGAGWTNAISVRGNSNGGTTFNVTPAGDMLTLGSILSNGLSGIGYATGAGGTVTQATSRTTGVTINKVSGAITMFSAAGSATAASFTVTNSAVAATDVIHLSQKSGTNLYNFLVTTVAAGSFNITFFTTGGTATDAPVINFVVIKGVTS